jgi:NDP-sugar pyrophosphorylase family protein
MIGLVLAAGASRRLRPYTDTLPKALLPVDGETTIMDVSLRNLASAGLTDVTIVVGYCADAVEERMAGFQDRYGVTITLV